MSGAFQTSREIFDNPIWKNIVEFRVFFLIYGKAIFAEEGYRVSEGLHLDRGQWLRSTRKLQEDLTYVENRQVKTYSTSVINRCIKSLVASHRLCTKTHELGTVFTVLNYEEYQGFDRYSKSELGTELGTVLEQSGNNNKNVKKDNKKPSSPKQVFDEQSMPYRISKYLYENILKFKSDLKEPNLQTWSKHIDYLIRLDNRDPKEIGQVIDWVTTDNFWQSVILSTENLRGKWDKITAKMKQGNFKQTNKQQTNLKIVQPTDEEREELRDAHRKQQQRNGVKDAVNI